MEHYITKIVIDKVRHLNNLEINLASDHRQHLILTGKNGAGKTSILNALESYLAVINYEDLHAYNEYVEKKLSNQKVTKYNDNLYGKYYKGLRVKWNDNYRLGRLYNKGQLITAVFPAFRNLALKQVHEIENVRLAVACPANFEPSELLLKYMVHLKTQQAYAQNENDEIIRTSIKKWFDRFENALKKLINDESVTLEYDYRNYNFRILQKGKEPFDFSTLSDGYASVIGIVSDLILRMDQNWLLKGVLSEYDKEGIVLIDELETHLHIELQRNILPFLTTFFPRIQFIVTTHSPYILTSIDNALVYDLERQIEINDPAMYSPEDIAEGYFEAENYSVKIKEMLLRFKELSEKDNITDDERAERSELRLHLNNSKGSLGVEIENFLEDLEGMKDGKV